MRIVTRTDDGRPIVAEFLEMARVVASERAPEASEITPVAAG